MAIGLLSVADEKDIKKYLPTILQTLKNCIPQKDSPTKRRSITLDPAIFACISFLAWAVMGYIKTEVKEMLDPMMAVGLPLALSTSLRELATYLPYLKRDSGWLVKD